MKRLRKFSCWPLPVTQVSEEADMFIRSMRHGKQRPRVSFLVPERKRVRSCCLFPFAFWSSSLMYPHVTSCEHFSQLFQPITTRRCSAGLRRSDWSHAGDSRPPPSHLGRGALCESRGPRTAERPKETPCWETPSS